MSLLLLLLFYSEHVIYECFKTCLRDIFMHNNATFKFITADQQLPPDAADISLPSFLQPPYSNFATRRARRRAFEPPPPPHQPATTPPRHPSLSRKDPARRSLSWTGKTPAPPVRHLLLEASWMNNPNALTVDSSFDEYDETASNVEWALPPFCLTFNSSFVERPSCCTEISRYSRATNTCSFRYNLPTKTTICPLVSFSVS